TQEGLLYYRIPHEETNLATWVLNMVNEFRDILGGDFGDNVRQVLAGEVTPKALGIALSADLATVRTINSKVLYIDELDRVAINQTFVDFITAAVDTLPDHMQIAVSSRLLTYN